MAQSSLLGIESAPQVAAGRDAQALGPSDTSDSGSDIAGVGAGQSDPGLPVDVALSGDRGRPTPSQDALEGGGSDHGGTGERRSAADDAGAPDGSDISTDRVIEAVPASEEI